ncbi:hypothetical protein GpartN1_g1492.t1 [Galdieria partita]|uniref:Transcription factor IIIC putative zinc-finger domain-containing protein n=1 Tax=Galdieria partita TaxID=83374 RepID=A0A9C7UNN5_9RHOD|nr:hypothetical protein GpartN1_g1492.t1 [Galdieria partita]
MEVTSNKWVPVLEKSFQMPTRNMKCLDWNEDNYLFIGFQGTLCALNLSNFNISEEDVNFPIKSQSEESDKVLFQRILTRLESDGDDLSELVAERNFLGFGELISVDVRKKEEEFLVLKGIPLRSLDFRKWLGNCIGAVLSGSRLNGVYLFLRKENEGSLILDTSSGSPWRNEYQFDIQVGVLTDISFCRDSCQLGYHHHEESLLFCFSGTRGAELWRICMNGNHSSSLEARCLQKLTNECVGSCKFVSSSSSAIISFGKQNGQIHICRLSDDRNSLLEVAQFYSNISSMIIEQCWFHVSNQIWIVMFCGGNSLCSVECEFLHDNQLQLKLVAATFDAHKAFITAICCNRWGHFATASLDGSVKLWTQKLQLIAFIRDEDYNYSIHGLAFSPNSICLAVLGNIRLETDERLTGAKPHSSVVIYCPFEGELYEQNYGQTWKCCLEDYCVMKETNLRPFVSWDIELANFRVWQWRKDQRQIDEFMKHIDIGYDSNESLVYRRILYCLKFLASKYFTVTWCESLLNEQSALISEHVCNSLKQLHNVKSKAFSSKGKRTRRRMNEELFHSLSNIEQGVVEGMLRYLQKWQPESFSEQREQFGILTDIHAESLEFCPICKERNLLPCSRNTPLVSSCLSGHIFRRCVLSLLPIVRSNNSLTCPSCWSGAIFFSSEMKWLSERYHCILCEQPMSFIEMNAEQELHLFRLLRNNISNQVG